LDEQEVTQVAFIDKLTGERKQVIKAFKKAERFGTGKDSVDSPSFHS
jgi:hypothetical protein